MGGCVSCVTTEIASERAGSRGNLGQSSFKTWTERPPVHDVHYQDSSLPTVLVCHTRTRKPRNKRQSGGGGGAGGGVPPHHTSQSTPTIINKNEAADKREQIMEAPQRTILPPVSVITKIGQHEAPHKREQTLRTSHKSPPSQCQNMRLQRAWTNHTQRSCVVVGALQQKMVLAFRTMRNAQGTRNWEGERKRP